MFNFALEVKPATKFKLLEELIPSSVPRKELEDLEITRHSSCRSVASDWFLPCSINSVYYKHTLPETNIAPENRPSKKETIVFQPSFSGAMLVFGGVIGIPSKKRTHQQNQHCPKLPLKTYKPMICRYSNWCNCPFPAEDTFRSSSAEPPSNFNPLLVILVWNTVCPQRFFCSSRTWTIMLSS